MSQFDRTSFERKVCSLADDKLLALVTINAKHHIAEAVEIAKTEVDKRGLAADLQNVHFDFYLNTTGFAGRLILLDEQILFLSTGLHAAPGGGRGIAGALASEKRQAERRLAATDLDYSALENEGSWIYYLDQIKTCETKTSLLSGKELILEAEEEDGSITRGVIKCGDLTADEFSTLARKIIEIKAAFEKSQASSPNSF